MLGGVSSSVRVTWMYHALVHLDLDTLDLTHPPNVIYTTLRGVLVRLGFFQSVRKRS